jgi:ABC-type branched-subunit amino acid transport system substrate-binding protein
VNSFVSKLTHISDMLFKLILISLLQFSFNTHIHAEITVGMTTPLSGPLQAVGSNVLTGVNAYFHRVNSNGGIHGQQVRLIAEDDRYEPSLAAPNMRKLIEEDNVIAVIGNVGTPTAVVTVPIAIESNVPFIGAITGAPLLRMNPPNRYIFNYRASYTEEAESMIDGLLNIGIKPEEIALFTQRDSYGDAGYDGAISALHSHGFLDTHTLSHGRYTRNSLNVEGALATILDSSVKPRAIIMAGSYAPSAKFIKLAKQDLPDCLFLNFSFVGSTPLLKALGDDTRNVIITEVVPAFDSNLPIAKRYRDDLKNYGQEIRPDFASFEGYIIANIFIAALGSIEGAIHRESLVNSLHKITELDIGLDQKITYTKHKHQAVHQVWPVTLDKNKFVPVNWIDFINNDKSVMLENRPD